MGNVFTKDQAIENLEREIVAAESWERDTSTRYAGVILATTLCIKLECTRKEIADTLKRHSKGSVSRFVALAHEELEHKAGTVTIEGKPFNSPVAALQAGVTSMRQVYLAYRRVLNPKKPTQYPADPAEPTREAIDMLTVRTTDGVVRVTSNLTAWMAAMEVLLDCPLAEKVIPKERKRMRTVLAKAAQGLAA